MHMIIEQLRLAVRRIRLEKPFSKHASHDTLKADCLSHIILSFFASPTRSSTPLSHPINCRHLVSVDLAAVLSLNANMLG